MDKTEIAFSRKFLKSYKKVPKKIKNTFKNRLELFIKEPLSPVLNNHSLKGKFKNRRSINITGDWRAIYYSEKTDRKIVFEEIGTHSQLYK